MTPQKVHRACRKNGGLSFSAVKGASTYGCLYEDGTGVVCGGQTKDQKTSCEVF